MTVSPAPELTTDERIGTNVHNLMWTRRLPQKDLARELGVSPSVLSKKLRGAAWYADQVEIAARYLDVEIGNLYRQPTLR